VRQQGAKPPKGAQEAVILFAIGEFKFAIAANAVREIRGLEGMERTANGPAPSLPAKASFILQRDGTTYFVVDGAKHFHLAAGNPQRLLVLRQSPVAVLADSADRIVEISVLHELPLVFTGEERDWYRGLAIIDGDVVPIVNPGAFLSTHEQSVLTAARQRANQATRRAEAV
jgi:chemotaxis signal transduction protein